MNREGTEYKAGQKIELGNWPSPYVKVMAVADGYIMARYKGCNPFVKSIKDFNELIERFGKTDL